MTRSPSLKMVLSIDSRVSVSLRSAIQATRLLTITSVGLSPTEHTSLYWTCTGTRCFSSSNQFRTMLILRGPSALAPVQRLLHHQETLAVRADVPRSQSVSHSGALYVPRKRTVGFPGLKVWLCFHSNCHCCIPVAVKKLPTIRRP